MTQPPELPDMGPFEAALQDPTIPLHEIPGYTEDELAKLSERGGRAVPVWDPETNEQSYLFVFPNALSLEAQAAETDRKLKLTKQLGSLVLIEELRIKISKIFLAAAIAGTVAPQIAGAITKTSESDTSLQSLILGSSLLLVSGSFRLSARKAKRQRQQAADELYGPKRS